MPAGGAISRNTSGPVSVKIPLATLHKNSVGSHGNSVAPIPAGQTALQSSAESHLGPSATDRLQSPEPPATTTGAPAADRERLQSPEPQPGPSGWNRLKSPETKPTGAATSGGWNRLKSPEPQSGTSSGQNPDSISVASITTIHAVSFNPNQVNSDKDDSSSVIPPRPISVIADITEVDGPASPNSIPSRQTMKDGGMRLRGIHTTSNGPTSSLNGSPSSSQVMAMMANSSLGSYLDSKRNSVNYSLSDPTPQPVIDDSASSMFQWKKVKGCCFSVAMRKVLCGFVVLALVTSTWVAATQFLKKTYISVPRYVYTFKYDINTSGVEFDGDDVIPDTTQQVDRGPDYLPVNDSQVAEELAFTKNSTEQWVFSAPFLTTWYCTTWTILFFPMYMVTVSSCSCICRNRINVSALLADSVRDFKEKGFTPVKFLTRCVLFCLLSVLTNYLYIASLRILECTVVTALFATNAGFVYLLSWVILHEQFVGVRIVAVILCNTGIALLAYMDGVSQNQTLFGVVLASSAAAGSAVYKVMFKKVMGNVSFGQVSLFFSVIGVINTVLLWPLVLLLYMTETEVADVYRIPWAPLSAAASLSLGANLLANLSLLFTYEHFITLGLIAAVPACAVYDTMYNNIEVEDMKLAGIIIVCAGFILVMFPENWAILLSSFVRWGRRSKNEQQARKHTEPDLRTGHIGSRLRSPSGRVR